MSHVIFVLLLFYESMDNVFVFGNLLEVGQEFLSFLSI
jgi:hypothetical protein